MSKTILITGCCGFIGSNLCEYYLKKNIKVIGIDNLLTGRMFNIKELLNNDSFEFIEHDVCSKLNTNLSIDEILHFASTASPIDYLKYPIKTLEIGSQGTKNILELALKNNATVLVASTSEIYGDPLEHPQRETYFGNVNPIGPRGVYDEAKRYLEALTMAYHNKYNLNTKIVRIFNTYGPKMRIQDGRAIPNFINQAINDKDITIYGDGLQTRSFSFIDDTINGINEVLNSKYNYPVNIGNPNEYSILDLVSKIKKLTSSNSKLKFYDLPENDPKVRKPNIDLALKILRWKPKVNLEDGLKKTINYFYNYK